MAQYWRSSVLLAVLLTVGVAFYSIAPSRATAQDPAPAAAAEPAPAAPEATTPAPEAAPEAAAEPAAPPTLESLKEGLDKFQFTANTLWVMIAGFLVFFMNLGFACVESGMCRQKNAVNILSKNFVVFAVATIGYFIIGFALMFGDGGSNNAMIGGTTLMVAGDDTPGGDTVYPGISFANCPLYAKFFFQLVFAATAATIVSGAVAERVKYHSFIVFSFFLTMLVYPIVGHWIWGGGWIGSLGFHDFAGSTQVHSVGGWAALAGILVLGPRLGKYGAGGKVNAIPGHSLPLATIGVFVLWLGWFGFNPGSTMTADGPAIAHIALTTNLAAAAGTLTSTIACWVVLGKPDLGMTLNGCLAGLVAITAPCACVTPVDAIIIGAIGGVIVVFSVIGFDKIGIDDPVGATSVHLVCGVFATLAVGIWANPTAIATTAAAVKPGLLYGGGTEQLMIQAQGIGAAAAFTFVASLAGWLVLKYTLGIRVSKEEEIEGLDVGEHGNQAYPNFVTTGVSHP